MFSTYVWWKSLQGGAVQSGYEPVNMLESHNKLDKNHINYIP